MVEIIDTIDVPATIAALVDPVLLDAMVAGANAKATRVAPCLASLDPEPSEDQLAEAKLILIGAVQRWVQAGTGAFSQQTAGPFSVATDTRQRSGYNLWPSEITDLQGICSTGQSAGAFSVDTVSTTSVHADVCSLNLGATYCSCGADYAGFPLWETAE